MCLCLDLGFISQDPCVRGFTVAEARVNSLPKIVCTRDLMLSCRLLPLWIADTTQEDRFAIVLPLALDAVSFKAVTIEGGRAYPAMDAALKLYDDE